MKIILGVLHTYMLLMIRLKKITLWLIFYCWKFFDHKTFENGLVSIFFQIWEYDNFDIEW